MSDLPKGVVEVGYVTGGHSGYDDRVWRWLEDRHDRIVEACPPRLERTASMDWLDVLPWFVLAGCSVKTGSWGPGDVHYTITFEGEIETLLERLEDIFAYLCAEVDAEGSEIADWRTA